jgi:hypothetical protein
VRYYNPKLETTHEISVTDFGIKSEKNFANYFEREHKVNVLKCEILKRYKNIYEIDDDCLLKNSNLIEEKEI